MVIIRNNIVYLSEDEPIDKIYNDIAREIIDDINLALYNIHAKDHKIDVVLTAEVIHGDFEITASFVPTGDDQIDRQIKAILKQ